MNVALSEPTTDLNICRSRHTAGRLSILMMIGLGLLMWSLHPVTHVAETFAIHQESHDSTLPEPADTDCLECVLLTTALPNPGPSGMYMDCGPESLLTVFEPFPVFSFQALGFSLRAPPLVYV